LLHDIVPHLHGASAVAAVLPSRVEQLVKLAFAVQVLVVHASPCTQVADPHVQNAVALYAFESTLAHVASAVVLHAFEPDKQY